MEILKKPETPDGSPVGCGVLVANDEGVGVGDCDESAGAPCMSLGEF
jgi:hypothetical protein